MPLSEYISAQTLSLIIVGVVVLWYASGFLSKQEQEQQSGASPINKIVCKANEIVLRGACVKPGPCGLRPTTNANCSASELICDKNISKWRCPLPCETLTNPVPQYLGSCSYNTIKCDENGMYYCPNDTDVCNAQGGYYGAMYPCRCNTDYYSDPLGQCKYKCPDGTYLYNNTCTRILPCVNGTFSKTDNMCICNPGYYNKNNICKLIPNCGNGTYNLITEICDCPAGYGGLNCQESCPSGSYYMNATCLTTLSCVRGNFNMTAGKCICDSTTNNYTGLLCQFSRDNCSNNGNALATASGGFQKCDCDTSPTPYYGPYCQDTKDSKCNGRGVPQYDSNGNFTRCTCDNPKNGGKSCQYLSSDYCHDKGKVITDANDNETTITCQCDMGTTGPYCCGIDVKPPVTDSCLQKDPICTKARNANDGWVMEMKTFNEVKATQGFLKGEGACATSKCTNINLNEYTVRLTASDDPGGVTVSCLKTCKKGQAICSGCNVTLPVAGTLDPKVCVCDSGTDSNYEPVCRPVQRNNVCAITNGSDLPQLCEDGQTVVGVNCTENECLYHCGGYKPDMSSDTGYGLALRSCIKQKESLTTQNKSGNPLGYWAKITEAGGSRLPVYPTIDNERCKQGLKASEFVNKFDNPGAYYYYLFNNPKKNVLADGTMVDRDTLSSNEYMLYNSVRNSNGIPTRLDNIGQQMEPGAVFGSANAALVDSTNQGCVLKKSDLCLGTFVQNCYKTDKTTKINCDLPDAYYKLNEGKCQYWKYYTRDQSPASLKEWLEACGATGPMPFFSKSRYREDTNETQTELRRYWLTPTSETIWTDKQFDNMPNAKRVTIEITASQANVSLPSEYQMMEFAYSDLYPSKRWNMNIVPGIQNKSQVWITQSGSIYSNSKLEVTNPISSVYRTWLGVYITYWGDCNPQTATIPPAGIYPC